MDEHLCLSSLTLLTPRRAGLVCGIDNTVDVLVRVQAPDAPLGHVAVRPPQAIALVIDHSVSMDGRPLAQARRCAQYVVGMMRPTDVVSLVQFDGRVQRLWPAEPLGDGAPLRTAIAGIEPGGNTNLHGGWREGAESLADVAGNALKRVILLSDGQANEGLTDPGPIAGQCAEWAARGVTTSTYGLGHGFNEELMVAMARAGGGNHYYGDTAEDLMDPFQQELELLGNLCLRDLRLSAAAPDVVEVKMVNRLPAADGGWRLPDLAWGAEAWAVLRLNVPALALPAPGQLLSVLRVSVEGRSLQGEAVSLERAGLALPVMSGSAFDQLADDELVSRRLAELAAADALSRMRSAADHGDWAAVDTLLEAARRRFAGNEWVAAVLVAMQEIAHSRSRERMMKESLYSASKLRSRLSAKDEGIAFSMAAEAVGKPAYLRRKPSQGKGYIEIFTVTGSTIEAGATATDNFNMLIGGWMSEPGYLQLGFDTFSSLGVTGIGLQSLSASVNLNPGDDVWLYTRLQTPAVNGAQVSASLSSSVTLTAVPEPGTLALVALSLVGLGLAGRRRH